MSTRVWKKLVFLPLMIVAVTVSGCGNGPTPKVSTGPAMPGPGGATSSAAVLPPPAAPTVDVRKISPEATLDADTLFAQREQNADRKYAGKVIEVNGKIKLVEAAKNDGAVAYVVGLDFKKDLTKGLVCFLLDSSAWSRLGTDQKLTLKGVYNPKLADGAFFGAQALSDCIIVKAGPTTQIVIDAEKLAQEFEANPRAASDKYESKTMIVSGEILPPDPKNPDKLVLKGTKDVRLLCGTYYDHFKKFTGKPGDKVKVHGRYDIPRSGQIVLSSASLLK